MATSAVRNRAPHSFRLRLFVFAVPLFATSVVSGEVMAQRGEDVFMITDRHGAPPGGPRVGLDAAAMHLDTPLLGNFNVLALHGRGEVDIADGNAAVSVTVPLAIARQGGATELAVGNFEFGGHWRFRPRPGTSVFLRLAITLPTGSSDPAGATVNGAAAIARVGDIALASPSTFVGRSALSVISRGRPFEARADVGLDVPLAEQTDLIDELSHTPLFRANLALGFRASSRVSYAIESVNVFGASDLLESTGVPIDGDVLHQLGVSTRRRSDGTWIHLGLFTDPSTLLSGDDGFHVILSATLTQRK